MQISSSQNMFSARRVYNSSTAASAANSSYVPAQNQKAQWEVAFRPDELLGKSTQLPQSLRIIENTPDYANNSQEKIFYIKGFDAENSNAEFISKPFKSLEEAVVHTPIVPNDKSHVELYQTQRGVDPLFDDPYGAEVENTIPRFKLEQWKKEGLEALQGKVDSVVLTAPYKTGDLEEIMVPPDNTPNGSSNPLYREIDSIQDIEELARNYVSFTARRDPGISDFWGMNVFEQDGIHNILSDLQDSPYIFIRNGLAPSPESGLTTPRAVQAEFSSVRDAVERAALEAMRPPSPVGEPILNARETDSLNSFFDSFNDPDVNMHGVWGDDATLPDIAMDAVLAQYRSGAISAGDADELAHIAYNQAMRRNDNEANGNNE